MRTVCKRINNHIDAPFVCYNNGRRIIKGVVFDVNDCDFSYGTFNYQGGFKRRRKFVYNYGWWYGLNRCLYKMRGDWYCIEKRTDNPCGGYLFERYEITETEANEIKASNGAALDKIFRICRQRAY